MSKVKKRTKIRIAIIAVIVLISTIVGGGIFLSKQKSPQEQAEDYILKEAHIGLKIYFKKYFNDVDPNSIKLRIEYHKGITTGPVIKGYIDGDKNLNFDCDVIRLPKNKWKTPQDELGMIISDSGMSGALGDMLKYEYSFDNPNRKPMKRPSELIPKSEVEKAKKDRDLLKYIPEMRTF